MFAKQRLTSDSFGQIDPPETSNHLNLTVAEYYVGSQMFYSVLVYGGETSGAVPAVQIKNLSLQAHVHNCQSWLQGVTNT
jgi:hypothetical protein